MIDRHLEKALNLRAVQVHCQHAVGTGGFEHVGHDTGADGDAGLVLLIAFGVREIRNNGGDLSGAGPFEGVDPEAELDQVVVHGPIGALHDENVAAAHIFQDPDEDVPFAEDLGLALGRLDSDLLADGGGQAMAATACKDFQLTVRIDHLGCRDRRIVHGLQFRTLASIGGSGSSAVTKDNPKVPFGSSSSLHKKSRES